MHRLTKDYTPSANIQKRQQWEYDDTVVMALRSLDKTDDLPYRRMTELMEWMRTLPRNNDNYGLVHCDLHRGNFFVNNGQITAFDFDDTCYHWFSYDLIPPLNSINKNMQESASQFSKEKVLESFLEGYEMENVLEKIWLDRLEVFDKYRAALLYHWLKTCVKENVFDAKNLEWVEKYLPLLLETIKTPIKFL